MDILWLETIAKNAITLGSLNPSNFMFLAILAMEFLRTTALVVMILQIVIEYKMAMNVLAFSDTTMIRLQTQNASPVIIHGN